MRIHISLCALTLLAFGINEVDAARPIDVGTRKQLFVDEKFIARSRGIKLTMNTPKKITEAVLATDAPWDGEPNATVGWYSSVIKDGDKIRIWGSGKAMLPVKMKSYGPVTHLFSYAESTDGIHFTQPEPALVAYDKDSAEVGKHGRIGGVSVWIDPQAPPQRRYKSQAKYYPVNRRSEFHIYCSPDGYKWRFMAREKIGSVDTQSVAFWDNSLQRYLLYTRDNPGSGTPSRRRVVRRLESDDLFTWENEVYAMDVDDVDNAIYNTLKPKPPVDFYGATIFKYPGDSPDSVYMMIAHAFWHWKHRPKEKRAGVYENKKSVFAPTTLDDRLAVSRDGIHFNRLGGRKPFISLGLAGSYSSKVIWSLPNPIRMGNELWIYYCADNRDHGGFVDPAASEHKKAIGRAVLRLDGFVSADAAYTGGEIVTPLTIFAGNKLELNADCGAGGSIRVELLDKNDKPIKGHKLEDATALCGNSVCLPVTWGTNDNVADLAGKPIKIRFVMRDCKLYAFQFSKRPCENG